MTATFSGGSGTNLTFTNFNACTIPGEADCCWWAIGEYWTFYLYYQTGAWRACLTQTCIWYYDPWMPPIFCNLGFGVGYIGDWNPYNNLTGITGSLGVSSGLLAGSFTIPGISYGSGSTCDIFAGQTATITITQT